VAEAKLEAGVKAQNACLQTSYQYQNHQINNSPKCLGNLSVGLLWTAEEKS